MMKRDTYVCGCVVTARWRRLSRAEFESGQPYEPMEPDFAVCGEHAHLVRNLRLDGWQLSDWLHKRVRRIVAVAEL